MQEKGKQRGKYKFLKEGCCMKFKILFRVMLVLIVSMGCKGHTGKPMSKIGVDTCTLGIINTNEKEIQQYYANRCDVGLDGIAVMPTKQQERYTDLAIELLRGDYSAVLISLYSLL